MRPLASILGTASACYELARLAVITRGRFRGKYWAWRLETAFGRGYPASKWELIKSILEYGEWVGRLRRGTR